MKRKLLLTGGLLFLAAALFLAGRNLLEEYHAARSAQELTMEIENYRSEKSTTTSLDFPLQTDPDTQKNVSETPPAPKEKTSVPQEQSQETPPSFDPSDFLGTLEIPSKDLVLPVFKDWSYELLQISPCRYDGALSENNLILLAHNYWHHFTKIKELHPGDSVSFTDMSNQTFFYEVQEISILDPDKPQDLYAGNWDLTLFTCTRNGTARSAVKCRKLQ